MHSEKFSGISPTDSPCRVRIIALSNLLFIGVNLIYRRAVLSLDEPWLCGYEMQFFLCQLCDDGLHFITLPLVFLALVVLGTIGRYCMTRCFRSGEMAVSSRNSGLPAAFKKE